MNNRLEIELGERDKEVMAQFHSNIITTVSLVCLSTTKTVKIFIDGDKVWLSLHTVTMHIISVTMAMPST